MAAKAGVELEVFLETEYPKVVAAVGLITGNRQDAADAVQDALLGFLTKPPEREIRNVAAWLTVVASNRMRDLQRSRAAEARAVGRLAPERHGYTAELQGLDVDLVAALEALPEGQRQICVLHYLVDQSIDTIAEGLGITAGSVKTQLHRARKALAKTVRREDHRG